MGLVPLLRAGASHSHPWPIRRSERCPKYLRSRGSSCYPFAVMSSQHYIDHLCPSADLATVMAARPDWTRELKELL